MNIRNWNPVMAFALSLGVALFLGCGEDDDGGPIDPGGNGEVNILSGMIAEDMTLSADREHLLRGAVSVEDGATLTIEAGTKIYGEGASTGTLVVKQGGKIMARGAASNPIVMSSDQEVGKRSRGQWGGLIINGYAPTNQGIQAGEGDTGDFGGNNPNDNSGVLEYVRVEYAGIEFSPDNELNGIAFQGVGSGTQVDYVQVHMNQDDGIEFFGGTVNAKHLLVTGARDDSFDWTDGWTGKGQFWVAQQYGDAADNGFENDNSSKNNDAEPRSAPTVYNVTLVGDPDGPGSDLGLLIREGAGGAYRNFIVVGFRKAGLEIANGSTIRLAQNGGLTVQNSIFFENSGGNFAGATDEGFDIADWATTASHNNSEADPMLADAFSKTAPDFRPGGAATDGSVKVAAPPSDGFFSPVNYIGGVDPASNWTDGWTTSSQN